MKARLKRLLEASAPGLLNAYRSIKNRRKFARYFSALHVQTKKLLFQDRKIAVLAGPFQGLKYINEIVWGPITPKWLGSYELELHTVVEEIIARDYGTIIDIGCAEGYYAVGLAFRMPSAQVFAYDSDFISRRQMRRLALLNGLGKRVNVSGYCSASEIERRAIGETLLICDIEGFERTLLDPVSCAALSRIDLLVEVHESAGMSSTLDLLKTRFSPTHLLQEITSTDRRIWAEAALHDAKFSISFEELYDAANERRDDDQKWLWMKTQVPADAQ